MQKKKPSKGCIYNKNLHSTLPSVPLYCINWGKLNVIRLVSVLDKWVDWF